MLIASTTASIDGETGCWFVGSGTVVVDELATVVDVSSGWLVVVVGSGTDVRGTEEEVEGIDVVGATVVVVSTTVVVVGSVVVGA